LVLCALIQDNADPLPVVQKQVAALIKDRIVVGHALHNDFQVLLLDHPRRLIRDTQRYQPFHEIAKQKRPGLKALAQKILGIDIQSGAHSSVRVFPLSPAVSGCILILLSFHLQVEDARAALLLYRMHRVHWEKSLITAEIKLKKPRAKKVKAGAAVQEASSKTAQRQKSVTGK
jgi:RNA exonuclease 4